jgi:hypothetical protein
MAFDASTILGPQERPAVDAELAATYFLLHYIPPRREEGDHRSATVSTFEPRLRARGLERENPAILILLETSVQHRGDTHLGPGPARVG